MLKKIAPYLSFFILYCIALTAQADQINTLLRQPNDPIAGNPKGSITIVEFFDYQCSYCMVMAPVLASIIHHNPNVRIVFKEYPMRGDLSMLAARAALAANKQGKYYSFNHALLTAKQPLTSRFIFATAEKVGLNVAKLKKDMDSQTIHNEIRANLKLGEAYGIEGTPSFFIAKTDATNTRDIIFYPGAMSTSELQQAIDALH